MVSEKAHKLLEGLSHGGCDDGEMCENAELGDYEDESEEEQRECDEEEEQIENMEEEEEEEQEDDMEEEEEQEEDMEEEEEERGEDMEEEREKAERSSGQPTAGPKCHKHVNVFMFSARRHEMAQKYASQRKHSSKPVRLKTY